MPGAVLSVNGLLLVFSAALMFNITRGLDVNCGCFSTGSDIPAMFAGWYLLRDMLFFAVGLFLFYAAFLQQRFQKKTISDQPDKESKKTVLHRKNGFT